MSAVGTRERSTQAPVAYEMPPEVVREAVINAIAHKDYASAIPIQVSVYHDKLMIWNAGQLPQDWTIEHLTAKHASAPYNPDIANAFFRVAFMESWGRGIDLIRNVCRAAGKPEPAFRWDNGLWVEFALQEARTLLETPGKTQGKTPARILELLQKNPNLTVPDIALQISKSESAVQRGILKLQIAGRLKRAGSRKSGHWELLK